MRPITPEERHLLEELHTVLQRPCQCPGKPLGHEDVKRDREGVPLLPIDYTAECRDKHLGCPHFLVQNSLKLKKCLRIMDYEQENPKISIMQSATGEFDRKARIARTNTGNIHELHTLVSVDEVPTRAEANERAEMIEKEFMTLMSETFEPERKKLLQVVEAALETGQVFS